MARWCTLATQTLDVGYGPTNRWCLALGHRFAARLAIKTRRTQCPHVSGGTVECVNFWGSDWSDGCFSLNAPCAGV
jgi:hypothetical protein